MIVYGHYSFTQKSFTQDDLGIPREDDSAPVEFVIKQRVAHIFWIPIFPIGKIYGMKRPNDSNLYEMPAELKQVIKSSKTVGVSPFSFTGIILALLVGAYILIGDEINSRRWAAEQENADTIELIENKHRINYPTAADTYKFQFDYDVRKAYNDFDGMLKLKVLSYDSENITFSTPLNTFVLDQEFTSSIDALGNPIGTFTISKSILIESLKKEKIQLKGFKNMTRFYDLEREDLEKLKV